MAKGSIELSTYIPPVAVNSPSAPGESRSGLRESPKAVSLLAAMASLALHVLTLTPVLSPGGVYRETHARVTSSRDRPGEATGDFAMQWVNLEETPGAKASDPNKSNNTGVRAFPDPMLQPITVSELPSEIRANYAGQTQDDGNMGSDRSRSANLSGEKVEGSEVYGLYVRKIKAQIERGWLRPRTHLDAPLFSCRARIAQDSSGNVQEVTLELCTADARWQQSLIRAIESASPLPAPPDPSIFTTALRISFESESYSPTAPPEHYEPSLTGSAHTPVPPAIQRNPRS